MDRHDEEFESFLRQFRLRKVNPLPEIVSIKRRSSFRWIMASAAAVVLFGVLSISYFRSPTTIGGSHATIEAAGTPSLYKAGELIGEGTPIRSNSAQGLMLALEDGSHVELRAQSELVLESAADGIRIRLNDGGILVTAARQGAGHLYVQTRDAMVSVVGTVFYVGAEQSSTQVAVVEGEVHVQQGTELKKLLSGEQVATNPLVQMGTVAQQVSWSRNAATYMVMLQQPAVREVPLISSPVQEIEKADTSLRGGFQLSTEPLPFKVQASYIRQGVEEVRTLITVEILTRDLAFQDIDGTQTAQANITGVIYRIDNRRIPGFSYPLKVVFPSQKAKNAKLDEPNLFQETRYLLPGRYNLHLTVEDKNSQSTKVIDIGLNVPRIPDQTLQASSMILAYSVTDLLPRTLGTEPFALGDKKVQPNVSGIFRRDQKLNIWQEFYGLTVDQATHKPSATFELVISQNKQEVKRLVTDSTDMEGAGPQMKYINAVSLAEFAPGQYEAQIKVNDKLAKVSLVTTSEFSVAAGPAQQTQSDTSNNAGKNIFDRACTVCHSAKDAASRIYSTKYAYQDLIIAERRKGATLSDAEIPPLADYLFNTYGKSSAPPEDLPVQRNRK